MQILLDLDQLRTFILIAETGSFTKTADTVFRTQSAISMQIRRLEERIGKPLFAKTGRQLQLTLYGEKLLTYARRLIELNDETVHSFHTDKLQANVRIGLPDIYLEHMIHDALQPIFHDNPAIETTLYCEPTGNLIEHIRRGTLDLALIAQKAGQNRTEILNVSPFVWVTSATNSPHEQDIIPLAMNRIHCALRKMLTDSMITMQREYRVTLSASSTRAMVMAVLAGNAVSILPENMVETGMRILNQTDGFPALPNCTLSLIHAQGIHTPAMSLITSAIQTSFRKTIRKPKFT